MNETRTKIEASHFDGLLHSSKVGENGENSKILSPGSDSADDWKWRVNRDFLNIMSLRQTHSKLTPDFETLNSLSN